MVEQDTFALRLALSVLHAIIDFRMPDEASVNYLVAYAPELRGLAPDELARQVVERICGSDRDQRKAAVRLCRKPAAQSIW